MNAAWPFHCNVVKTGTLKARTIERWNGGIAENDPKPYNTELRKMTPNPKTGSGCHVFFVFCFLFFCFFVFLFFCFFVFFVFLFFCFFVFLFFLFFCFFVFLFLIVLINFLNNFKIF